MAAGATATQASAGESTLHSLMAALQRLDRLLQAGVVRAQALYGAEAAVDRFRGLHIGDGEVQRLLTREPLSPTLFAEGAGFPGNTSDRESDGSRLAWLRQAFNLSAFDMDVILIALAPEVDLRYERLYAYLQDDVTRKRPTVDLVLNLLCATAEERLARRSAFASDGALLRNAIVHLASDPNYVHPPLLAQCVKPDEQIVHFLLGDGGLDSRLSSSCRIILPTVEFSELVIPPETRRELTRLARGSSTAAPGLCLWFHGATGAGKAEAAQALARRTGTTLVALDASRVELGDIEITFRLAIREASLRRAFLYVEHAEYWRNEPPILRLLAVLVQGRACSVIFGSTEPLPAALLGAATPLAFPVPDAAGRARCWRQALAARGIDVEKATMSALAGRFRLTPAQIASAVSDAVLHTGGRPGEKDLLGAARAQSGEALAALADKIEPRATWDDIVLSADAINQLRELCARVDYRDRVLNDWGFGRRLSRGRGTTALFTGGPGTGKTMAAEVIANALGLYLYRIDLARVVSKYIGETEKNLDRVFTAAGGADAILFFDEADALFGKRSEVRDAHDRYANIEISYLLQKMEEYEGVAILATNLADHLDKAFTRRLAFHVYFPFPDEAARLQIWMRAWPKEVPISGSVDCRALAHALRLAGGSIRNISLAATFLAAADGGFVTMAHLLLATERENLKLGKTLRLEELCAGVRLVAK
jgi:AAA+ superfamily predicted ATPase